ncbi:MAG: sulfatase-like hydrolase/transferase, partial [Woeseiaceae bacterium]
MLSICGIVSFYDSETDPEYATKMRIQNAILLSVFVALSALSPAAHAVPNLVIFIADDMGWGDVGYHGSEIRTPSIDRLAAEGVALERFYAHPACSPTRGALMTGRSPLQTGVLIPFEPWFSSGLPLKEKLLPEYLKDVGYQTFAVGKWHLGPNRLAYHPTSRGFDHFYGHLGGFINYVQHTYWRGVDWQRNGKTVVEDGYSTNLIADEAISLIKSRDKDEPLFLYVAFNAPHSPLQAPLSAVAEYADISDLNRRTYAAMVSEMDRGIGRVLSA